MVDERIAQLQQRILAAKLCARALRRQNRVQNLVWFWVLLVTFGLVGGITGGWTGAIGLMAMFVTLYALGEWIANVLARRRYAAFLRDMDRREVRPP